MIVAGVGCRAACPAAEIVAVVQDACARGNRTAEMLAAPAFKSHEPGLREAAATLRLPLRLVDAVALADAQPRCVTRSTAAQAATGLASVAEACALAVAGAGARLVLPRIAHARATCALAEGA